jgi:hypothetical protein
MQAECYRCRVEAASWTIETDGEHSFNELSFEEAILDWPTVVEKHRDTVQSMLLDRTDSNARVQLTPSGATLSFGRGI